MCTIVLAWRVFESAPVVVAANRDEAVGRPSSPPGVIETDPRVVAPVDERAGGTWIGFNDAGLFAAVTNRWTDAELAGERSRGLLVRDVLDCSSVSEATALVEDAVAGTEYDGFMLVVADATQAVLLTWDGALDYQQFDPGVHVIGNVGTDQGGTVPSFDRFDEPTARKRRAAAQAQLTAATRAKEALTPRDGETPEDWRDRAAERLGDHDYGFCVHRDGFGTRSSSLVSISGPGEASYEFADGPPCETAYEPVQFD